MQPLSSSSDKSTAPAAPAVSFAGANQIQAASAAKSGVDERIFFCSIAVGILLIGLLTTYSILRERPASPLPGGGVTSVFAPGTDGAGGPARRLIDFSLTDRTGRPVHRSDLAGQVLIVNFVFTGCSLSCLRVNDRMADLQKRFLAVPGVRLVSLTVDPASDTPAALARFASQFGADTNRWLFLTGDKRVLYPVLEQSFLGPPRTDGPVGIPGGFGHTDGIALVDATGAVRAMFNGLRGGVAEEIAAAVESLRQERGSR